MIHPTPAMKVGSVLSQPTGVRQMVTMPLSAQGMLSIPQIAIVYLFTCVTLKAGDLSVTATATYFDPLDQASTVGISFYTLFKLHVGY